jgi:hypothetical protein
MFFIPCWCNGNSRTMFDLVLLQDVGSNPRQGMSLRCEFSFIHRFNG